MADQEIETAVTRALEEAPPRNFRETVDLAINLRDIDLDEPSNRIDEDVVLPAGTGQETSIVAFAEGETALRAEEVADDVLGGDDLADGTDFFLAEQAMMQDIASQLGIVLGPRNKMPDPVEPDDDIVEMVERLKNSVTVESGDRKTFHTRVGAGDMSAGEIGDNIDVILRRLQADLEKGPLNLDAVYMKTTMGPAVEVA